MKQKAKQTDNNSVRQMTDAELRRALDYSIGDRVIFFKNSEATRGTIDAIKLARNEHFFVYQIAYNDNGNIAYIQARGDQIRFIKHADDD